MSDFSKWTERDVFLHNARVKRENRIETDFATVVLSGKTEVLPMFEPCRDESDLHRDILDACKRRGWIALHGSMAQATARTPGEWDFVILADRGRVFLIECKSATGKLSPEQYAMHHWASNLGHSPAVVRSLEEFEAMVRDRIILQRTPEAPMPGTKAPQEV